MSFTRRVPPFLHWAESARFILRSLHQQLPACFSTEFTSRHFGRAKYLAFLLLMLLIVGVHMRHQHQKQHKTGKVKRTGPTLWVPRAIYSGRHFVATVKIKECGTHGTNLSRREKLLRAKSLKKMTSRKMRPNYTTAPNRRCDDGLRAIARNF